MKLIRRVALTSPSTDRALTDGEVKREGEFYFILYFVC